MADEKLFTIPLRKEWLKVPMYKRSKRAVDTVRKFVIKHVKDENVKIGKHLNTKILERGRKNPPHKVQVKVVKDDDAMVVELADAQIVKRKIDVVEVKKKKTGKEKIEDMVQGLTSKKEDKSETEEKEKAEVLKHPDEKDVAQPKEVKVPEKKEFQEKARKETLVQKDEKPTHEKKK